MLMMMIMISIALALLNTSRTTALYQGLPSIAAVILEPSQYLEYSRSIDKAVYMHIVTWLLMVEDGLLYSESK